MWFTKKLVFGIAIFAFMALNTPNLFAQSYKIYKKDTINRIDAKGRKQGVWKKIYDTGGVLSEGTFKDNHQTGLFKYYYEGGKLKGTAEFYNDGINCSFTGYHENGKVEAVGNYINEKKDSVWKYYSDDSLLLSLENYKKGVPEGVWRTFYKIGRASCRESV